MVSRVVETKLLLTGQDAASKTFDQVAKAAGGVSKAFDQVAKAGKASAEVDRLTKAVDRQAQALRQVEEQRRAASARASADMSHRLAISRMGEVTKALEAARKAQKAFDDARKGSKTADDVAKAQQHTRAVADLTEKHRAAMRVQREAAGTLRIHSEALDRAKAATRGYGLPIMDLDRHQQALKKSIEATTGAIKRQQEAERNAAEAHHRRRLQEDARLQRRAGRREAIGTAAAAGGVVAAYRGKEVMWDAIRGVKEFDDAQKRQVAYTPGMTEKLQEPLLAQAKKIGQQTQFTNTDVIKAQTKAMQGLPANFTSEVRAQVGEGIVENVKNFATLMEVDLTQGAEIIRSYLQQTQKDISTKEKALAEANKATNQLVVAAKLGGSSGEDVKEYVKFATSSGTMAGLSSETLLTLGAIARRGGLRGDEAGTFVRTAASKLVAPTKGGREALSAAGIDYDKFVRMPDKLDTAALERSFTDTTGKAFTPAVRRRVEAINADKRLFADREKYIEAVTSAVEPMLQRDRKGKVSAQETRQVAKAAGGYHKLASESVDTEGLLKEILSGKMTLQQFNKFFTDKHGGKAALTASQYTELAAVFSEIKDAEKDPNYAKNKADYIMSGVAGSLENRKGSYENFTLQIGKANEGLIKFTADGLGKALDGFSKLDTTTQQLVSVGGGLAVAVGGVASGIVLLKNALGVGGLGASAGALTGSATALATSAAALDAAAVKLAGGSPGGGVVGGAAEGAKQTKRQSLMKRAFKVGGRIIMAYTIYEAVKIASEMAEDADPSGVTNDAASDPMLMTGGGGLAGRVATRTMSHLKETALRDAKRNALDAGLDTLSGLSLPGAIVKAIPLPDARDQGAEIGIAAGSGIANGVKEKAPEVLEQGKSIYEGLQNIFRDPLSIPMSFTPRGGASGGTGGGLIQASYGGAPSEVVRRAGGGIDLGGVIAGSDGTLSGPRAGAPARPAGEGSGWGVRSPRRGRSADGGYTSDESWYDAVIKAEGTAKGGRDPYNTVLGYGAHGSPDKPLTEMTLAEAYKFGRKVRSRHGSSSAIGAFQIVGRTMKDVMAEAGLGWDDRFTPENQRKLADVVRKRQGFGAWEGFKNDPRELGRARDAVRRGAVPGAVAKDDPAVSAPTAAPTPPMAMPPKLPEAPPGGLGSARGDAEMLRASNRMNEAADRFAAMRLNTLHTIELTGGGRDGARVKGMRATADGPISADMGISMPQTRSTRTA